MPPNKGQSTTPFGLTPSAIRQAAVRECLGRGSVSRGPGLGDVRPEEGKGRKQVTTNSRFWFRPFTVQYTCLAYDPRKKKERIMEKLD